MYSVMSQILLGDDALIVPAAKILIWTARRRTPIRNASGGR